MSEDGGKKKPPKLRARRAQMDLRARQYLPKLYSAELALPMRL